MRRTSLTSSFFLIAEMLVKFGESAACCAGVGYFDNGVLALKLGFVTEFCCNFTSSLIWVTAGLVGSTCAVTFLTVSFSSSSPDFLLFLLLLLVLGSRKQQARSILMFYF